MNELRPSEWASICWIWEVGWLTGLGGRGLDIGKIRHKERSKNLHKYWFEDITGSNPYHMISDILRDLRQSRLLSQLLVPHPITNRIINLHPLPYNFAVPPASGGMYHLTLWLNGLSMWLALANDMVADMTQAKTWNRLCIPTAYASYPAGCKRKMSYPNQAQPRSANSSSS